MYLLKNITYKPTNKKDHYRWEETNQFETIRKYKRSTCHHHIYYY